MIVRRCDLESVRCHVKLIRCFATGYGGGRWIRVLANPQGGGVGRARLEDWRDQRCALLFSVVVELLDTELARGFPRSDHALSNGGRGASGTGTPKLPAVLVLP